MWSILELFVYWVALFLATGLLIALSYLIAFIGYLIETSNKDRDKETNEKIKFSTIHSSVIKVIGVMLIPVYILGFLASILIFFL